MEWNYGITLRMHSQHGLAMGSALTVCRCSHTRQLHCILLVLVPVELSMREHYTALWSGVLGYMAKDEGQRALHAVPHSHLAMSHEDYE